jgi:hypothetical protein
MRLLGVLVFALALPAISISSRARAGDMDLQLSRLSVSTDRSLSYESACGDTLEAPLTLRFGDPGEQQQRLSVDQQSFRSLVTQLAPAVTPTVLAPVTTTGPAGFDVAIETTLTGITESADYWRRGTRGHGSAARATCDGENRFVSPLLATNRIHFSKGLPLGVTLGGTVGKLHQTSVWLVGMDLKLAILEGLRGIPAPDLAARAAVSTALGDSTYSLTVVSLDGILSKNIVTGRVMTISPYGGVGWVWTFAASELVDLTPNIDALSCAAGSDATCNADAPGASGSLGASPDDIGHDVPFRDVRFGRYRGFVGLAMRYKLFALAAEFMVDLVPPKDADSRAGDTRRQWSFNAAPSLSF